MRSLVPCPLKPNPIFRPSASIRSFRARTFEPPPRIRQHAHIKESRRIQRSTRIDRRSEISGSRIAGDLHCSKSGTKFSNECPWPVVFSEAKSSLLQLLDATCNTERKTTPHQSWRASPATFANLLTRPSREVQNFAKRPKALGVKNMTASPSTWE